MATVIDELTIILGFDSKPDGLKPLDRFKEKLDSFTKMVGWASAGIIGMATSIGYFASKSAAGALSISNFSKLTGISTDAVQRWSSAAEVMGLSGDAVLGTLQSLTSQIHQPFGLGEALTTFLGQGKVQELMAANKTGVDALYAIAERMESIPKHLRLNYATSTLGLDQATALMTMGGRKGISDALSKSSAISPRAIENAAAFARSLNEISIYLKSLGGELASVLGPALKGVIGDWTKWVAENRKFISSRLEVLMLGIVKGFKDFGTHIKVARDFLVDMFPKLKEVIGSVTAEGIGKIVEWALKLGTLIVSLSTLGTVFGPAIALLGAGGPYAIAIAAAVAAGALLIVNWDKVEAAANERWPRIMAVIERSCAKIKEILGELPNIPGAKMLSGILYYLEETLPAKLLPGIGRKVEEFTGTAPFFDAYNAMSNQYGMLSWGGNLFPAMRQDMAKGPVSTNANNMTINLTTTGSPSDALPEMLRFSALALGGSY